MKDLHPCETVTFGVIAYNERQYLPDLLSDLLEQTYSRGKIEVVLVDGASDDGTRAIMEDFEKNHGDEFWAVKVRDNPKRVQPAGWNVVIENAEADVVLRVDAHARLPRDFIEMSMRRINAGEQVCGGPRENIIDEETGWKRMLLDAEQSMFGSGFAAYRQETGALKYVDSVFHGAYRRELFDQVGLFNEALVRTEDNEMHHRLRQAGHRICYDPAIKSFYQTRNSLRGMLKQKHENGFWIGKTLKVCPGCISPFHLAPLLFVLALCAGLGLLAAGIWLPLAALLGAYLLFTLMNTAVCLVKGGNGYDLLLPVVYFLIHCSYGLGTARGLIVG